MIIESLLFYLFSAIIIISAIAVISAKNPVNSVLCLILAFFSSSGIFILVGAEFIAMVIIIVYVGAIAVLFLFIVMMLNINIVTIKENFLKHAVLTIPIIGILFIDFYILINMSSPANRIIPSIPIDKNITNTHAIGKVLYTEYAYNLEIAGMILISAMIITIALTIMPKGNNKRQNLAKQLDRNKENSIEIIKSDLLNKKEVSGI